MVYGIIILLLLWILLMMISVFIASIESHGKRELLLLIQSFILFFVLAYAVKVGYDSYPETQPRPAIYGPPVPSESETSRH